MDTEKKKKYNRYTREWYRKHPGYAAGRSKEYIKENKEAWIALLSKLGRLKCTKCGYDKCFAALEFHHIDPKEKKAKVSDFWQKCITKERIEEIDKTITLCSNCHREFHTEHGYRIK